MSVGLGGYPDRSGEVTLDAAIMRAPSQRGSVCCVRRFMHPVSIARLVMETTPHVLLAGDGADRFAKLQGMTPVDLLTNAARLAWQKWIGQHAAARYADQLASFPPANIEERGPLDQLAAAADDALPDTRASHDTVAVLARDAAGEMAGACSTSGAAVATGAGELVMGVCGTFLAVEAMRPGASPLEAAIEVLGRIIDGYPLRDEHQVAIIAMDRGGRWSSAALRAGCHTAVRTPGRDELVEPERVMLA
jgi:isoaspartyl peptidase/L-asparaginase-like protein (Ntn-hydrolase superfamily)